MANKTFLLTDESVNAYGFWLKLDGADIEQFRRNPIMLWMHSRSWRGTRDEVLPIGTWDNIRIENGKLLADAAIDTDDEFAAAIARKVDKGIIRMASVGITVLETSSAPENLKPGQTRETVTKWRLREASLVDIGANDNAISLAFYDNDGNPIELNTGNGNCPVNLVQSPKPTYSMKEIAKLLNLSDEADERTMADRVQELLKRNAELEQQVNQYAERERQQRKERSAKLIDEAIRTGRINADARQAWEMMFDTSYEVAEQAILALPKRQSVRDTLTKDASSRADRYASMTWDELDRKGKLRELKADYPELYAQKFEEKFGRQPKS
ncbi:hypothetical protein [Tenuifilum osseticum]|uniref:hypothetical protein n=1 Tax=Tenuifilum TaxID=2760873 RepID=UPI0030B3F363